MSSTYIIPKRLIMGAILFLACLMLFFYGATQQSKIDNASELKDLTEPMMIEGHDVKVSIDRYLTKHNGRSDSYSGVGDSLIGLTDKYFTYTVPLKDGRYVRVRITTVDLHDQLKRYAVEKVDIEKDDHFSFANGGPVEFLGEIHKGENINQTWYQNAEGFDPADLILSLEIREKKVDSFKSYIYISIAGMIIGVILALTSGGIRERIETISVAKPANTDAKVDGDPGKSSAPAVPYVAYNPGWDFFEEEEPKETIGEAAQPAEGEKSEEDKPAEEKKEADEKPEEGESE